MVDEKYLLDNFPTELIVTDQSIDLSSLTLEQKEFYISLLKEILSLYAKSNKKRITIGFAGPSGSGKSVLVEIIIRLYEMCSRSLDIVEVGIDAYSYTNDYLLSHTDGTESLKNHKGRYDTYDVKKLIDDLASFREGNSVSFPMYSRKIHNPIENYMKVESESNSILLVEGLWLLSDEMEWGQVRPHLDFCYFIDADESYVKELTIKRHILGGRSEEDARNYYEHVDSKNFNLVVATKHKADKLLPAFTNIFTTSM